MSKNAGLREGHPAIVYRPWPRVLQWLCGVFIHPDRNTSTGIEGTHFAYCRRCGRIFGFPWGGARNG